MQDVPSGRLSQAFLNTFIACLLLFGHLYMMSFHQISIGNMRTHLWILYKSDHSDVDSESIINNRTFSEVAVSRIFLSIVGLGTGMVWRHSEVIYLSSKEK